MEAKGMRTSPPRACSTWSWWSGLPFACTSSIPSSRSGPLRRSHALPAMSSMAETRSMGQIMIGVICVCICVLCQKNACGIALWVPSSGCDGLSDGLGDGG